jgi:hypothetical protein
MTVLRFEVALYELQGVDSPVNGTLVEFSAISFQDVGSNNLDRTTVVMVSK